jgi:hypothetical protein
VTNVEFVKGHIEEIPLADATVDVVISNCVINPGRQARGTSRSCAYCDRWPLRGSDVIAYAGMDEATRGDMQQWTGCVAGALTRTEFERALSAAGLVDIEIRETHRVHEHAAAAIVRAAKPAGACCSTTTLETCCEPSAKAECCGEPAQTAPTSCGCS